MNEKLDSLILNARLTHNDRELILGFLRYEALRKLNVQEFHELYKKRLDSMKKFDHHVDDLVIKNYIDKSAPKI